MNLFKSLWHPLEIVKKFTLWGGGSGGGGGTSQQTTVQELPEWAKPYAQQTLAKAQTLTEQPYQTYEAPRIAGFSPLQQQAQQQAAGMAPSEQLGTATGLAQTAGMMGLGTQYQPQYFGNQFRAPGQYQPSQFSMLAAQAPTLQQFQMGPAQQVGTQAFTGENVNQYMSPYMQSVVNQQQREAMRQSGIAGTQLAGQATQAGAFGGSRYGLMEAERQRNLATQLGDIQATGSQAAFQNAQQQFNQQQQANLQAQLANQGAGLTVGQQNLQALLGIQQLGAGQNLQSQLANQQMLQAAQQAAEQSRQYGYGQAMTAAQQRAQYGLAGQQAAEQSRQFGANLGLQGLGTSLQAAGTLGNLGQTQFGQQMGINQLVNQYGQQQQALEQQGLSQAYQDFLNQQNYPYKQLGFMSDILKGTPTGQSTAMTMYQSPGSMLGQLGGLGLGAYGLSRLLAEGGEVNEYADGGSVTSDSFEESALERIRANDEALIRAKESALARRDVDTANYIDKLLAENASVRSGLGNAFDQLPFSTQEAMMAGGGIVAFADRGAVKSDEPTDEEIEAAKKPFIGTPMIVRPRGKEYGESGFLKGLSNFLVPPTYAVDKKPTEASAAPSTDEMAAFDRATADYMTSRAKPAAPTAAPAKAAPTDGGIKDALKVMSATHGLSEKTLMDNYTQMYDQLSKENAPLLERLNKAIEKSAGRADKAKSEALPKALAEFGFQWAAAASKPGARFVGSAAAASPTLAASAAESQKAIDKAEDVYNQLQMEQAKFEMALKKGDRATAMQHATNARQLEVSLRQLQLQAQQIAQTGAYQQGQLGIMQRDLTRKEAADKARALSGLAGLQRAQASMAEVGRKAGLDFDNSRQARDLMKQLTEQYGNTDKAKYMYNQQRRAYINEATQGMRDQTERDMQVRSVFDLLNAE